MAGITFQDLDAIAYAISDSEAAQHMNEALSQRDFLVAGGYRAEKIPQLVMGNIGKTEPRRRGETLEA
jgi:hypothetical protein